MCSLEDGAMWLCRAALAGAALVLAGTAALRLLAWGSGVAPGAEPRWNRLAVACWTTLLLASVLQLGLTAAQMSGLPLADVLHRRVLAGTDFGTVWKARLALLAGLFVAGVAASASGRDGRQKLRRVADVAAVVLAVLVVASLVAAGHAHAVEGNVWLLPVDMIHATAAGAWPGGLVPLVLLLARARRRPERLLPAVTITRRFSRLSVAAVGVLALSGSLNACALVGTFAGLWTSAYGRLLLGKGAIFLTMAALGAANKRLIERRPEENPAATVGGLWRNVAAECVAGVGVLLATEALAMSTPAASAD